MNQQLHLTPAELVDRLRGRITVRGLEQWRRIGKGPRFLRVGKGVLYPVSAVEEYEASMTKRSTVG